MIDIKFFSSIGVPVYTADEEGLHMINASDLEDFEYYSDEEIEQDIKQRFEKAEPALVKTLEALRTAIYWLHESHDYESDMLDDMCSRLEDHERFLSELLRAKKV